MGTHTGIQWTDYTFNPWWGCEKVSPACDHCYAEALAKRYGHAVWGGREAPRRFFSAKHWAEPNAWNRAAAKDGVRRRVFCASMADVFEDRPDLEDARGSLFGLMEVTPMLDWQVLTKRPANITRLVPSDWLTHWPAHVWMGTTAEDQHWLDIRARYLADVPAPIRFLSYEPTLGPLPTLAFYTSSDGQQRPRFQWVIAGGESGSGARAIDPDWVRSVRDQCLATHTPFFFKQWGGFHPKAHGAVLDGREWKQFPDTAAA
jgi:protein gp37